MIALQDHKFIYDFKAFFLNATRFVNQWLRNLVLIFGCVLLCSCATDQANVSSVNNTDKDAFSVMMDKHHQASKDTEAKVYCAGVAFRAADIQTASPNSFAIKTELSKQFRSELLRSEHNYRNFKFDPDELADKGSPIFFSLVINHETVSKATIPQISGNEYKTIIDVYADLIFFNSDQKKVISSIPFCYEYIDLADHQRTSKELQNLFKNLYFGELSGIDGQNIPNLFQKAATTLETWNPFAFSRGIIQVNTPTFSERVQKDGFTGKEKLSNQYRVNPEVFSDVVAQKFSSQLAAIGLQVNPYSPSKGAAENGLLNSIQCQFDDPEKGEILYQLNEPTATFDIEFRDFRVRRNDELASSNLSVEGYFVFLGMKYQPRDSAQSNAPTLHHIFRASQTGELFPTQESNKFAVFSETVADFTSHLVGNIRSPNEEWLKDVVPENHIPGVRMELDKTRYHLEKQLKL